MASIFGANFRENLARIHSRGKSEDSASKIDSGNAHDFSQVLADLEKRLDNSSKIEGFPTNTILPTPFEKVENPAGDVLTNLASSDINLPSHAPLERFKSPDIFENSWGDSPEISVNKLASGVKVQPEVALAPETPHLLSVKRIQDTPELATKTNQMAFNEGEVRKIITAAGKFHGVDPQLGMAIAQAESSLNTEAVSQDGHASKGIFQLLDSTGKEMLGKLDVGERYEPFDPGLNAHLGVGYLRRLLDIFSNETTLTSKMKTTPAKSAASLEKIAIAAFNAGEGRVCRAQEKARAEGKDPSDFAAIEEHLPASTRLYVARVTKFKAELEKAEEGTTVV